MDRVTRPSARDGTLVLALNAGSSSLKFGLYRVDDDSTVAIVSDTVAMHASHEREAVVDTVAKVLADAHAPRPDIVGHRIVHGGPDLVEPCLVDDAMLDRLEKLRALAPLHAPLALSFIRFAGARFDGVPQMACFDTAFHARLPDIARTLPIPRAWRDAGIRRYGFHGLSCESILHQLGDDVPTRLVIAHLGNGASVTAVKDGVSVDTSMGLTPGGGVMMGTRSGDLDPGVLLYLMREEGLDAAACEDLVERRSGLLGVSGISGDLRDLHREAPNQPDARLAIDMFCASVAKQIAAMAVVLDGIALLVFTGGIGEHDAQVRASVCRSLAWFGLMLDPVRNAAGETDIHQADSRCRVRIVASQEERQIARHARRLVA